MHGPNHPFLISLLIKIGDIYIEIDKKDIALKFFLKAINIMKE